MLYTGAPGQRVKAHDEYIILEPSQSKSPLPSMSFVSSVLVYR